MSNNHTVNIIWSIPASRDIARLRSFIEPHNKDAAKRAAEAIKKVVSILAEYPQIGKAIEGKQEREISIPFGQKGYVMRYRLHNNNVVILRVWHGLEDR